jgi:hypothetical protein
VAKGLPKQYHLGAKGAKITSLRKINPSLERASWWKSPKDAPLPVTHAGNAAETFALRRASESTSGEEGWYRANPRSFDGVFYFV